MTKQGTFHWNELVSTDLRRSKAFYTKLIGWKTQAMKMPGGTYTLLVNDADGPPAGGMFKMPAEGKKKMPDQWVPYIAVDDVDAAAAKVKKLGGKVMKPPFDVEGVGRICVIADPGGAGLALITPAAMG
jgi:predicted enzyme related to lactoylglutathione lyase